MQTCSSTAIVGWLGFFCVFFLLALIQLIPVRKSSCHYRHQQTILVKVSGNSPQFQTWRKKMPFLCVESDFPLVIRLAKVDLHRVKTWKHLKYQ